MYVSCGNRYLDGIKFNDELTNWPAIKPIKPNLFTKCGQPSRGRGIRNYDINSNLKVSIRIY